MASWKAIDAPDPVCPACCDMHPLRSRPEPFRGRGPVDLADFSDRLLVVASFQQVLLIKNIEASLAKYAYGLLDIVGKYGNGWATSRSAQKRVRVVNTDFPAEQRRPRMKKRPFPGWQIDDEEFRLTDLETCAAHQIIGPVRVVEDHAADCAIESVDNRYSEDANLGLVEQPGEAQKLPDPVLNEYGLLPDRWHVMRLGCFERFNIHN